MKEFSTHWSGSKRPGKQRKLIAKAPLHTRGQFLNSHLSKELRQKHKRRSVRVRKGDRVKIARGNFSGLSGIVERVDTRHFRVFVTGIAVTKKDGTKSLYPIHASKIVITELAADARRIGGVKE